MILWAAKPAVKPLDNLLYNHVICVYIEGIKYLKFLDSVDIAPVFIALRCKTK